MACAERKDTNMMALNLQYDSILLKYAEGKREEALISLWSLVCADMLSTTTLALETASGSPPEPGAVLQSCSLSPVLQPEISINRFQLTEEEMSLTACLFASCSRSIWAQSLRSGLLSCYFIFKAAEAFLDMHINVEGANLASIDELVDILHSLRQRRVSLFGHAARGYFEYLSSSFTKHQESYNESFHLDASKEKAKKSCSLRAMLFILHILLNYGVELNEIFELGFAKVPLLTWQEITPQLFARLSSHPKQAVRKQLERLLLMLAKLSPWSVVYPTLVDKMACEGEYSEEIQHLLDYEAARIAGNSTLSYGEKTKLNAAKYSALMAPVVVALERRLASTSREPETAHEIWFQEEYGEQLKLAILAFKTPPGSAAALGDVWQPFDAIATSLASHQRKSSIYH
ncbi:hypothetical protein J5N97_009999 [Dioscorea zingiberensis]|uniref:FAT domain-containing protein n=1 Tax=Dioscorea zingiberensis TaxID=325984 RepID=A0A9D5CZE5_9LILI|nr:hypothetical protein J5N97_009999 [Dioscorea zingiberensis]